MLLFFFIFKDYFSTWLLKIHELAKLFVPSEQLQAVSQSNATTHSTDLTINCLKLGKITEHYLLFIPALILKYRPARLRKEIKKLK